MKKVVAEAYRDIDFSRATRGPVIKIDPGKTKISIRLDNAVLEHFKNEDPILEIRAYIYKHDIATPAELEAIEARIEVVVEESVKFAEESPYPDASELYEDVYHTPNYPYIRL